MRIFPDFASIVGKWVTVEGCGVQNNKPKNKQMEAVTTTEVQNANQVAQDAAGATTSCQAAHLRKRDKMEWVQVHAKSSKIQPDSRISHPIAVPELGISLVF